jgi:hypothetical protein
MAGKFLRRGAIIDTIKSEQRTNAIQKRKGLKKHPVRVTSCGCPDPNCGAWHTILTDRTVPTDVEATQLLVQGKQKRKYRKPHPKYRKPRAAKRPTV